MNNFVQDVRYGFRVLAKSPGFAIVAILTLALGIGANTAIFSMVDSFLFRPLPVKDPQQLTVIAYQQKNGPVLNQFSIAEYHDMRNATPETFSGLFGYQVGMDGLSVDGQADRIMTNYVTGNFFSTLGIKPAVGRLLLPSEGETLNADPVIVLGYTYWKTRFGGDTTIVGRQVSVDGHPMTVVGVTPEGFYGVYPILNVQGYLPLGMAGIDGSPSDFATNRAYRNLAVLGRLQADKTLAQAQATLAVVGQRLSQEYPKEEKDLALQVYPEIRARPNPDPKNTLLVISGLFLGTRFAGAAAGVHQCGEHFVGSRDGAGTGNGDSRGAGSGAHSIDPAIADGERAAGAGRRRGGNFAGSMGKRGTCFHESSGRSSHPAGFRI